MKQKEMSKIKLGGINNLHANPTDYPAVGYPKLCILTNRTAEATSSDVIIKTENEVAYDYQNDKVERENIEINAPESIFWKRRFQASLDYFIPNEVYGECDTYSYRNEFNHVHNSNTDGSANDTPQRELSYLHTFPIYAPDVERLE